MLVNGRGLLAGAGKQGAALRVVALGGVQQAGESRGLIALLVQAFQLLHGGGEQQRRGRP